MRAEAHLCAGRKSGAPTTHQGCRHGTLRHTHTHVHRPHCLFQPQTLTVELIVLSATLSWNLSDMISFNYNSRTEMKCTSFRVVWSRFLNTPNTGDTFGHCCGTAVGQCDRCNEYTVHTYTVHQTPASLLHPQQLQGRFSACNTKGE